MARPAEPCAWTDEYRSVYPLHLWEPTGGWTVVFMPLQTNEQASRGEVRIGRRGEGRFEIRDLSLQKVSRKR